MVKGKSFQYKEITKGDADLIITHKLKMNLEEGELNQRLEMPLGDVGSRQIELMLYSRQNPWTIPDGVAVLIRYKKPDGTNGEYDTLPDGTAAWSVSGNALKLLLAPQILEAAGSVLLYASMYLEEKVLHTFAVEICVKAPFDGKRAGSAVSSKDYAYVTSILRSPAQAQKDQVLTVGAVDAYGRVTEVEAVDTATLVREGSDAILHTEQTLGEWQKRQARANIEAQEQHKRREYSRTAFFDAAAENFVEMDGAGVYEYGDRQTWIRDFNCFDFSCYLEVDGEVHFFTKSDCLSVDLGHNGDQWWVFNTMKIPNCDTILSIGNGMHPITGEHNGKLVIACQTGKVVSFTFYQTEAKIVQAQPVFSVNGELPDWNGNVAMPKYQVMYSKQSLTERQKAQARKNIAAAPSGYGWGEKAAASLPGGDADNALTSGLYSATADSVNTPAGCKLIVTQAVSSGYIFQTAYCPDGVVAIREHDHGAWSQWRQLTEKQKVYEKIATITVEADKDNPLPKYVIFMADSNGKAFYLTEFMIKAYAGFVDGNKSTLYMTVNGNSVIANGAIGSISSSLRSFNVFFRQEKNGYRRVEYTSSMMSDGYYNPQASIESSRLIPPISAVAALPVTNIALYTELGDTKAWVEGSTFELWGVRV